MRQADHAKSAAAPIDSTASPARHPPPELADGWALFLDVDGCLLDLAATPDAVVVPQGLPAYLAELHARLHGALALVSGRTIATLDALFAPSRLNAVGLHGVERRYGNGTSNAAAVPPELIKVRDEAARLATVYEGALVEDKGVAIALHWRQAPDAEQALQAFAAHSLDRLPGYRLQQGKQVVEMYPGNPEGGSIDKGAAIATLLDLPPFSGRVPVFAGDDLTDESGFEVVNARDGLSVLVGDRTRSAARHHLPDPTAVRAWLGFTGESP